MPTLTREALHARAWAEPTPAQWKGPRFDSPFERRRLRLFNSLAFAFGKVGARLIVRGNSGRDLEVRVGTQRMALTLDAPGAQPSLLGEWKTCPGPAGPLVLRTVERRDTDDAPERWVDTDDTPLEAQLANIVASILVAAEVRYRAAEAAGHARRIEWRAEIAADLRRRQADAVRRRDEREDMKAHARRERLLGQAHDWRTARDIRGFVAEVPAEIGEEPDDDAALADWRAWSLAEADLLDPAAGGLQPWVPDDDDEFERPCGCGFKCERYCGCGLRMVCECDCPGEQDRDDDHWQRFPDP